ncbi:uncharacterized protein LOC110666879 isoform X2 [Hevea brasiliensis]|uniref:uncharacterized protein LOC110666879 isoform X2 n=1 Tax=Hevea brasiliensis TaxID=3981 RepID=UPI0025D17B79|nr:uncharacterized protein LOC110666879 isoform X2 [Hevea brasiliensis]XP_057990833.1 uncharacterized protein LOC110666879 isoform X2 [Hevea brasiliensis]XP_057990834.1 uncharacterized protein LOC110666879 isoform X2 [Hevea brasiliensis]
MAAEFNTGFRREEALGSAFNRHAISIQSDAINSSSEIIPMGSYFGMNTSNSTVILPGHSSMFNSSARGILHVQAVNSSSSSLFLDIAPDLKHDTGLAIEWSVDEQYKLDEGLSKFTDEPNIMRYIKIAAMLPDKTVRDVALRSRWMMVGSFLRVMMAALVFGAKNAAAAAAVVVRKRRKAEEHNLGEKFNSRKDKLVESSPTTNIPSAVPRSMPVCPIMMHYLDQGEPLSFEGISGTSRHLLEQNAQAFRKITANLSMFNVSSFKLQDNIDLFCHTRNNITAILNDMREMPGIMSQMPPLPVSINEDLANSILLTTTQSMMFGSPRGIQLKQEPRC